MVVHNRLQSYNCFPSRKLGVGEQDLRRRRQSDEVHCTPPCMFTSGFTCQHKEKGATAPLPLHCCTCWPAGVGLQELQAASHVSIAAHAHTCYIKLVRFTPNMLPMLMFNVCRTLLLAG
jgi:hypothetical protein